MSNMTAEQAFEAASAAAIGANRGLQILPVYLGGYLDSLFMGIVICQCFTYWQFIRTDKKHIVALMVATVAATTLATAFILHWNIYLFVWNFGTFGVFAEVYWIIRYMSLELCVIFLVQMLYTDRACRLYGHWWPAVVIPPFSVATMILGSVVLKIFGSHGTHNSAELLADPVLVPVAYCWYSGIIVTDSIITIIIVYGISRIQTQYKATKSVLNRILITAFESQTPALISSLVCIVAWNRQFEIALHLVVLQSKIYTMGALITLNLRAGLAPSNEVHVYTTQQATSAYAMDAFPQTRPPLSAGGVHVTTDVYKHTDDLDTMGKKRVSFNPGTSNRRADSNDSFEDSKHSIQDKDGVLELNNNESEIRLV